MIAYLASLPWLRIVGAGFLCCAAFSILMMAFSDRIERDGDDREFTPEAPTIPKQRRTLSVKDRLALRQLQAHEQEEAEAHDVG